MVWVKVLAESLAGGARSEEGSAAVTRDTPLSDRDTPLSDCQKSLKSGQNEVQMKDDGESYSKKLRRIPNYIFYMRDPPKTSLKITCSTKIQKIKDLGN